ncbi:MAG: alanine/glycine:cation symporter family protein [Bacillota bacterium]|nr:alanine/glycine:cation symporter family protein [Bacillota bacterium]
MDALQKIIGTINGYLYYPILIIMLLGVGLYFTFKTKNVQIKQFGETWRVLNQKPDKEGGVSSFQALMVSTASRVGTGNIVGVSSALCLGGYGAVFWMWVVAMIGGASAFIESTLAQVYKKRDDEGNSYGGPAYYIEAGLKSRPLAIIFAISLIACYAVGFNMLAAFNIQSSFAGYSFYNESVTPWIIGAILALLTGYTVLGGGKRIIKITEKVVPFMGVIYVIASLIMIVLNITAIPSVFGKIFADAFNFKAIFGGLAGSSMVYGIKRGLYSNEAGIGSAPNAAAAADVSHPVKQGLVQMFSVFLDTIIICSATAFMGLSSGIEPIPELEGAPYIQEALATSFGNFGYYFISISLVLFGFSTLVGNLYYVDSNIVYINKKMPKKQTQTIYRVVCALLIFFGAGQDISFVWDLSDLLMGVMAFINLPCILVLGGVATKCLFDYTKQRKAGQEPVFVAKNIGLDDSKLDYWK